MSATIETIITCDGGTNKCEGNDWSADMRSKTALEQRKSAHRDRGWKYRNGKDFCPACWQEIKQTT